MTGTTKILTILICTALIVICQIFSWDVTDPLIRAVTNGMALGLAAFCALVIIRSR